MMEQKKSNRIEKINSLIQEQLGPIIQEYTGESGGLVTITKVETSRDLKWTKIWISIIGGSDEKILETLHKNIYDIQGELNHNLPTKILPRIQFSLDTSPRYAAHIDELIRRVEDEKNN